ncbi:uncharacterized protein LOC143676060 isoform X2 [Tamandua tetradactyla]|uniref:uncharacterized protein LOC143676060 isoform X2 n=1 Tax=Tamandua tetradactyla TaxID=48850 RepID=UPI004053BFD3
MLAVIFNWTHNDPVRQVYSDSMEAAQCNSPLSVQADAGYRYPSHYTSRLELHWVLNLNKAPASTAEPDIKKVWWEETR